MDHPRCELVRINPCDKFVVGRTRDGLQAFVGIVITFATPARWQVVRLLFRESGDWASGSLADLGPMSAQHRERAAAQTDAWCAELGLRAESIYVRPFDEHRRYGVSLRSLESAEEDRAGDGPVMDEEAPSPDYELRMGDDVFWIDGKSGELTDT
jgi:hypothetical protein